MDKDPLKTVLPTPWHVVRGINFMLSLPPIEGYRIYMTRRGDPRTFKVERIAYQKGRFKVKNGMFSFHQWSKLIPGDKIRDTLGRVLLNVSDYPQPKQKRKRKKKRIVYHDYVFEQG